MYNEFKCRLFVDMDGTLNCFNNHIDSIDALYKKGFFENLSPRNQVIKGLKEFMKHDKEVYILTNISNSKYAVDEKNKWIDKYLPDIDKQHRIFVPFGEDVFTYVQNKITPTDFLLDDSIENLKYWDKNGTGIKLINEVNDKDSSWDGEEIHCNKDSLAIAYQLKSIQNRCILNELMYNKDFFIEEEKKNVINELFDLGDDLNGNNLSYRDLQLALITGRDLDGIDIPNDTPEERQAEEHTEKMIKEEKYTREVD